MKKRKKRVKTGLEIIDEMVKKGYMFSMNLTFDDDYPVGHDYSGIRGAFQTREEWLEGAKAPVVKFVEWSICPSDDFDEFVREARKRASPINKRRPKDRFSLPKKITKSLQQIIDDY